MTTEHIDVFVPNTDHQDGTLLAAMIAERSGIVGDALLDPAGTTRIYYEGNVYGYENVVTFADRVEVAAGRFTERAPTIARSVVPDRALLKVGEFIPTQRRVEVTDEVALAGWLGLGSAVPKDQLNVTRGGMA